MRYGTFKEMMKNKKSWELFYSWLYTEYKIEYNQDRTIIYSDFITSSSSEYFSGIDDKIILCLMPHFFNHRLISLEISTDIFNIDFCDLKEYCEKAFKYLEKEL